jgi:hypothetical protein
LSPTLRRASSMRLRAKRFANTRRVVQRACDPSGSAHRSLHFKKVAAFQSVRVGLHYRALAVDADDGDIVWFWIGSHAEYDALLGRPSAGQTSGKKALAPPSRKVLKRLDQSDKAILPIRRPLLSASGQRRAWTTPSGIAWASDFAGPSSVLSILLRAQ